MTEKRRRARTKWTETGRLRGRPPGSRSHDDASSRADDPPIRTPERRGRPPTPLSQMILRFVQMVKGLDNPRYARWLAAEETGGRKVTETSIKRRMRKDRSEARKRRNYFDPEATN